MGSPARAFSALVSGNDLTDADTAALLRTIFWCGVALQAAACLNAEFSVEQGEAGNIWEPLHYLLYGPYPLPQQPGLVRYQL
jgi:hypothetical protein